MNFQLPIAPKNNYIFLINKKIKTKPIYFQANFFLFGPKTKLFSLNFNY